MTPHLSQVKLVIRPARGGADQALTLTREKVSIPAVTSSLCKATKTGYLRLTSFSRATPDAAASALTALIMGGAQRFVLDLRDNGGGVFPSAVAVARQWLPPARDVVLIADANGVRDSYATDDGALAPRGAPLTVLVNRGTASAAEVLAGALRDNGRAVVAGEATFGKGLIQTVVPLSDGSALAVTVARYQTPAGDDINRVGIPPDLPLPDGGVGLVPIGDGFCGVVEGGEGRVDLFSVAAVDRCKK